MKPYRRSVQYYETDMMGITHHANYVRWMEEARIDFMDQIGYPYAAMERQGIVSPVTSVSCRYLRPSTFGDTVEVTVSVESFDGVTLTLRYGMRKAGDGELVCEASSGHVFLDREGRFVRMRRAMPDFCETVRRLTEKAEPETK